MYENPFRPLNLTILPKLRFLGFRIYGTEHSVQLEWIIQALTQGSVPSTMEELAIFARDEEEDGFIIAGGFSEICWTFAESELDCILGSDDCTYPNLRRVNVIIETPDEKELECQKEMASMLARKLPRLAKRGILYAQLCGVHEVQAKMSTLLTM